MNSRSCWRTVYSALLLALLGAGWNFLAPVSAGGQAQYVIVSGASMSPVLQEGDLAIVRTATEYRMGEIITYRHPLLGPIIHRIIDLDGDRFVLKGDSNSWIDSYHPRQEELIGKLWLILPKVGKILSQFKDPRFVALLALGSGLLLMSARSRKSKRDRLPMSEADVRQGLGHTGSRARTYVGLQSTFFGLALLGFSSMLLAIASFSRPIWHLTHDELPYRHEGYFDYTAAVPYGVYESDRVKTGEPIFRRLINTFEVQFRYRIAGDQLGETHGSYLMVAEISDGSGWKRRIEIRPRESFEGDSLSTSAVVNLDQVQALIDTLEKGTGIHRVFYTLAVIPVVEVEGRLAGLQFQEQFAPRLEFKLDELELQPIEMDETDPFAIVEHKSLQQQRPEAAMLTLLSLQMSVWSARWISGTGLALTIVAALVFAIHKARIDRKGVVAQISLKYGPLLVMVEQFNLHASQHVLDVKSIDHLAKIATEKRSVILCEKFRGEIRYYVKDGNTIFRYLLKEERAENPEEAKGGKRFEGPIGDRNRTDGAQR
jgi:signal peptidase I